MTILITGGTGSFGQAFAKEALTHNPKKIIIYSRDEFKQELMSKELNNNRLRFFIGDVRDSERLHRAFNGVDIVIHAAALKQVPACEYNPSEAVKTNILGAMNILNTAINCGVEKVVALSTDKAVNPVNLYGATKAAAEKIFTAGNVYSQKGKTKLSLVRYGNVAGSRGSVIPFFESLIKQGDIIMPLTDERMTRFHIDLADAINLVMIALNEMKGGEIFVPKISSFKITELIKFLGYCYSLQLTYKLIGIRQGEKLHETLISNDEACKTYDCGKYYIISEDKLKKKKVDADFSYVSNENEDWLYGY